MSITIRGRKINTTIGFVLVRIDKHEKVTAAGIIIPDTVDKETDYSGTVVAVSKTEQNIVVGERVLVKKNSGATVETDDDKNQYKLYPKTEILYAWT
jgi:co-chaperonin GroES (HSP10)